MQNPHVSVIFPVYNGQRYLRKAIESVLGQTYNEFTLLICDDCSTDNSLEIIQSYADHRIKLLQNSVNRGLFPTLNRLIQATETEYIRIFAQDDIMKPDCLAREILFHQQHPEIGMSYCHRDTIDREGNVILYAPEDNTPDVVSPDLGNQISFYYGSMPGNIANVMLKRSVLNEVGLFREDMKVSGDFEMWVRIMGKYPIGFIRESLIYLRSHQGQFSRKKGINVIFIKEDQEIFATLTERLPSQIKPHALAYRQRHHYTQYIHHIFRCLLAGDWQTAVKTYQAVSQLDNVLVLIWWWVVTGNSRWLRKSPKFV